MSKQTPEYWREKKREQRERAKLEAAKLAPLSERLPSPLNPDKPPRWGPGVPNYIPPTLEEKAALNDIVLLERPMEWVKPAEASTSEWELCLARAERARKYAIAMPDHVRPGEVVYQDPMWQWDNEVKKRVVRLRS
jgi:hypothetical protein